MELLIVDDQQSAAKGLIEGINWSALGIDKVASAQNAMEARLYFQNSAPQIMLCDIEMPVENGIDFCRWVRDNGFTTRIIFLTCHADFLYAQDAVKLGAVDYILQPAPYSKIEEVLYRVTCELRASEGHQQLLNMGKQYKKQRVIIRSALLCNYLNGNTGLRSLEAIADILKLDAPLRLVLFCVLSNTSLTKEDWTDELMLTALANFSEDIFSPSRYRHLSAVVQPGIFCIALQDVTTIGSNLTEVEMVKDVQYLYDAFQVYIPHKIACYISENSSADNLPRVWQQLIKQHEANVVKIPGVFMHTKQENSKQLLHPFENIPTLHWKIILNEGNYRELKKGAISTLDNMVQSGNMNADSLLSFYRGFMQLLIDANDNMHIMEWFNTPESIELYRNGMKSVDNMKALICYVASRGEEKPPAVNDHQEIVANVISYIKANLGDNLRVENLAKLMYMSPDHLTRVFKRETGQTLKSYITQSRMKEAKTLLRTTQIPISHIAAKLGYNNFSHFSTAYKKEMGISPQDERK